MSQPLLLSKELDALLSTLLAGALPVEQEVRADRLERAVASAGHLADEVREELNSAVTLVRDGQPCAAVTALLAARSALVPPPRPDLSRGAPAPAAAPPTPG